MPELTRDVLDFLIAVVRAVHPWPWRAVEVYLAIVVVTFVVWLLIDWAVDRAARVLRRWRIRRVLREKGTYRDPSIPVGVPERGPPLDRGSRRHGTALSGAAPRGVDGPDHQAAPMATPEPARDSIRDTYGSSAQTLVDPRVAGYGQGTSLEADPAQTRVRPNS